MLHVLHQASLKPLSSIQGQIISTLSPAVRPSLPLIIIVALEKRVGESTHMLSLSLLPFSPRLCISLVTVPHL